MFDTHTFTQSTLRGQGTCAYLYGVLRIPISLRQTWIDRPFFNWQTKAHPTLNPPPPPQTVRLKRFPERVGPFNPFIVLRVPLDRHRRTRFLLSTVQIFIAFLKTNSSRFTCRLHNHVRTAFPRVGKYWREQSPAVKKGLWITRKKNTGRRGRRVKRQAGEKRGSICTHAEHTHTQHAYVH